MKFWLVRAMASSIVALRATSFAPFLRRAHWATVMMIELKDHAVFGHFAARPVLSWLWTGWSEEPL